MAYRLARSLEHLRAQINAQWPKRNKASDGWIGDAKHASRSSDHNPWVRDGSTGVVTALDITHDPTHGVDGTAIAEVVKDDPRVKYVIWNRRIWNAAKGKQWRGYTGTNPHTKHIHVSVKSDKASYDSDKPWQLGDITAVPQAVEVPPSPTKPTVKQGSKNGAVVRDLQALLGVEIDGKFGPKTKEALISFQKATGLVPDGIAGPYTWDALLQKGAPTAPVAPPVGSLDSEPRWAINFLQSLGWPKLVATALTAHLMWESGGNSKNTIKWDAHGDKGEDGKFHSHGAPQWNDRHGRWQAYQAFAENRGVPWTDRESQLRYLAHELSTTERGVSKRLMKASTLEEAVRIAVDFWRPSVPHLDKRLAIARTLDGK
jgi:hypothetical protein